MVYLLSEEEIEAFNEFSDMIDNASDMDMEAQRLLMEEMLIRFKKAQRPEGERRRLPRVKCDMSIGYTARDRCYRSRVTDINEDGLFIVTPERLPPGQTLKILVDRSKGDDPIRFSGSVVRAGSNGFVAMFINLNFYTDALIRAAVGKLRAAEADFLRSRAPAGVKSAKLPRRRRRRFP